MAFEKSVLVPLDVDETFAMITRPDRLRRWQVIAARVDLRVGGDYRWTIIPGHSAAGTFTEVEPGRRVVLTWGWEGSADLPPGASTVIITLEQAPGGTLVHLVHEGLTDEQAAGHAEGWHHYLDRLVVAGAEGDAGPDEWGVPRELDPIVGAEAALAICQVVLRGISDADSHLPTSCTEFDIAQLGDHLLGSVRSLGAMAGAAPGYGAAGSLEVRVADAAQAAIEAWTIRGVDGEVTVRAHPLPARLAVGILAIELLVHAWDLARATGQRVTVPGELAEYVLGVAHQVISPEVRASGSFAPPLAPDPDAGSIGRLIAFTGRAM